MSKDGRHQKTTTNPPPSPIDAIKTITTTYPSPKKKKTKQKNYTPTKYIRKLIRMRTKNLVKKTKGQIGWKANSTFNGLELVEGVA